MNNILIAGYYGLNNIGDECILSGIINSIRSIKDDCTFQVLTSDGDGTHRLHGVSPVQQSITLPPTKLMYQLLLGGQLMDISRAIDKADLLILGGGSLLQDLRPHYMPSLMGLLKLAMMKGKRTAVYGVGAGPIDTTIGKRLAREVLNKVDIVTVRDRMSLETLQDCGVRNVVMTCDPAFGMHIPPAPARAEHDVSRLFDGNEDVVCSTFYRWLHDSDLNRNSQKADPLHSQKMQILLDIYTDIMDCNDYRMVFLPTVLSDVNEYRRMSEKIGPRTKALDYRNDLEFITGTLGSSRLLLGMRLHSLILATMMGVPFVPISYCGKVKSYLELIGLSDLYLDVEDLTKSDFGKGYFKNFEKVASQSKCYSERLLEKASDMRDIAIGNAKMVIEQMGRAE